MFPNKNLYFLIAFLFISSLLTPTSPPTFVFPNFFSILFFFPILTASVFWCLISSFLCLYLHQASTHTDQVTKNWKQPTEKYEKSTFFPRVAKTCLIEKSPSTRVYGISFNSIYLCVCVCVCAHLYVIRLQLWSTCQQFCTMLRKYLMPNSSGKLFLQKTNTYR